jgi:hypothetical protein
MKIIFNVIVIIVIMASLACFLIGCDFNPGLDHPDVIAFKEQLEALEGGTNEFEPITVRLTPLTFSTDESVPPSIVAWGAINTTVANAQKYIILDLSDCTASGNKIEGGSTFFSGFFDPENIINIIYRNDYVKGIILPSTLKTIGDLAFYDCAYLTSITIPDSVTSIGKGVFSGCITLSNIKLNDTNSRYTYENRLLFNKDKTTLIAYLEREEETSFTIPNNVTTIGNGAFYDCDDLVSVNIPNNVTSIGDSAFYQCYNLADISLPESTTSIGNEAFLFCRSLTKINIPNSVRDIGDGAFFGCDNLTEIIIPNSVISIGDRAFWGCNSLNQVMVESTNTNYSSEQGILFNKNKTTLILYPEGKSATSYTIPNTVTIIGKDAFYYCYNLTSVIIPNGVKTIKEDAFNGCGISSITIPASVSNIEAGAFLNSGLETVTFNSANVKISNNYAFPTHYSSVSLKHLYESRRGGAGTYTFEQIGVDYFWKKQ